jgi:CDP-6-deoxy-D-xylo-4-hexulose-3-dehydrase
MKINKDNIKFYHPLMKNNIRASDSANVIKLLKKKDPILTQNVNVKKFEEKWSKWLGVKYSVFVNSGSSANFLTFAYLKTILKKDDEVIVPALTWVSDITSVLNNGFKTVFVDINLKNLAMSVEEIKKCISRRTKVIFLTHILGFNGLTNEIIEICKKNNIILIEDVCESHGANFDKKKLGTFGLISNFSFYYAHHMTTIEGGMISTSSNKVYEVLRMMRGHGMLREAESHLLKKKNYMKYGKLNKDFIFLYPGYNFRSTEINAIMGINQLKRLNNNIKRRNINFKIFINNLDKKKYLTQFDIEGISNYAFVIIFNKKYRNLKFRSRFEKKLRINHIEFRRGTSGGGNQLRQPYLKYYNYNFKKYNFFYNTEVIHNYGYYIGNYPELNKTVILKICNILNDIS